jgi:hypothetical protein
VVAEGATAVVEDETLTYISKQNLEEKRGKDRVKRSGARGEIGGGRGWGSLPGVLCGRDFFFAFESFLVRGTRALPLILQYLEKRKIVLHYYLC